MMDINIVKMTKEYAQQISHWKYDGPYAFYNHSDSNIEGFMDDTHFACTHISGELVGYFCYGNDARIPTIEENVYDDNFLDIGLGLRPDLCGKGHGLAFFLKGIDYAQLRYNTKNLRLAVATFNERAIKLYSRAGFYVEREVTNLRFNNKFVIMKYEG